jgi:hypothetical protein
LVIVHYVGQSAGAVYKPEAFTVRTFDDLVIIVATFMMRCVLMAGTAFAYVQMLALCLVCAMAGTVGLAVVITIAKGVILPK